MFTKKEKDKTFQLLLELAKASKEAGHIFFEYKIQSPEDLTALSKQLKSYELRGQVVLPPILVPVTKLVNV